MSLIPHHLASSNVLIQTENLVNTRRNLYMYTVSTFSSLIMPSSDAGYTVFKANTHHYNTNLPYAPSQASHSSIHYIHKPTYLLSSNPAIIFQSNHSYSATEVFRLPCSVVLTAFQSSAHRPPHQPMPSHARNPAQCQAAQEPDRVPRRGEYLSTESFSHIPRVLLLG